jgi:hypothetical protein
MAQQPPRRGGWTTAAVLGLLVLLMGRALYVQNETAQRRDGFMNGDVPRQRAHRRHDASEHVNFFDQFMRSEAEARSLREREADQQRWNTPEPPPPIQQKPLQRPGRGSTPRDECTFMMQKHSVIPGANWGSLGPNGQRRWTKLRCDGLVGGARVRAPPPRHINVPELETCPPSQNQPLIALCCGTTTRGKQGWITPSRLDDLAVFHHLLPSFHRTVECGFRYVVVLGYDIGDRWWDLGGGAEEGRRWFQENIKSKLAAKNVQVELRYAVVDNKVKKPGPVFTGITREAFYEAKADYIYRVNDDTELATRWAKHFVEALSSMNNVGAVGPACQQGNRRILTHDFTHRTHMEIFGGQYYPPQLSDWWMDDWISRVYGPRRTLRGDSVEVIHHTGKHGQRYQVDRSHANLLHGLLQKGAAQIERHLAQTTEDNVVREPPDGFSRFAFNNRPGGARGMRSRPLGRRGGARVFSG